MASIRTRRAITESEIALRNSLWRDAPTALWDRTVYGGFTTLPKTYPYIAKIMDDLSKGFPLSSTYLALWCSTWDNAFVRLNRPADMAFAAGFSGERAERTWTDRMKRLERLGFVETKPSGASKFGFAFIPNPHGVIVRLHAAKSDPSAPPDLRELASGLTEAAYNAFVERALEVGANDVKELLAPPKAPPAPNAKQGANLKRKHKMGGSI
ncbi:hypothetical protein [Brevundimonas diminuta]|uniref:hypothetical protein n=1 Tax=Brevundimonas diminuta TaxID=293 RepID=UPI000AAEC662|nr:hypothetical protein [Brevundimonas diminuta]